MHFEEKNWQQIEDYLDHDDRVMLILGACEQHCTLSLLTDSKIPLALAEAASQASGVMIAPPLHFGISPYFLSYAGTISLRIHTYINLVEDIVQSLYGHGFCRVLILNGHGGNVPAKTNLVELVNRHPDLKIRWYSWWLSPAVHQFALERNLVTAHANWMENFTFTRVGPVPQGDKEPLMETNISGKDATKELAGDGSYGGLYQVDDGTMQQLFDLCLTEVMQLLKFD